MFTALLSARPLIKYGIIAGISGALFLSYLGWKEYQQYIGREEERTKQQAELMQQAQESAIQAATQAQILQHKVEEAIQEKESVRGELEAARKEITRYAKLNKARVLDANVIRVVNEFTRVLNDSTPDQRMPSTNGAPTESPVEAKTAPTTVDAFERLNELTTRITECETDHRMLSEWAIEKYQAELVFYYKVPLLQTKEEE